MRIILKSIIVFSLLLFLTGCGGNPDIHTSEELEKAIDELECTTPSGKCNLEGKYTIIGEQNDETKNEKRLNVKLNDYNITFDMISRYRVWGGCDGPCAEGYVIETNYYGNVFKYYYDKFNETHTINLCEIDEKEYENIVLKCNINTKEDIATFSNYFSEFVKYLNDSKSDLYFAKDNKVIVIQTYLPEDDEPYIINHPSSNIDLYIRANKQKKYSMSVDTVSIHDKFGNTLYCNDNGEIYDKLYNIMHNRICKINRKIPNLYKYLSDINNKYDLVQ